MPQRGVIVYSAGRQRSVRQTKHGVRDAAVGLSLIGSAYVMSLANTAGDCAWLGWFALLPFFVVIRQWRPLQAMFAGGLWGLCLYLFSVVQPGAVFTSSIVSLLLLTAIPASYAAGGAWLTRWIGFNPLVLGVAWMGVELALEPLGLRAGLLGGANTDSPLLHWVHQALGYVFAAFLAALVNASLVSLLSAARLPRPLFRHLIRLEDGKATPSLRTSVCLPRYAIRPSQPRAPPPALVRLT